MARILAVSGKGGTGKTIISALIVRRLIEEGASILAIDADPDSNLPDALGVEVETTIGDLREELVSSYDRIPPGVSKDSYVEYQVIRALAELDDFDLLVMGRPEGPGCYCAVNHLLRLAIDRLASSYDVVVIDCEAGLEHISRRTTRDVDDMLVVSEPSLKSIRTAERIIELAGKLDVNVERIWLVVNKVTEESRRKLDDILSGFENLLGFVRYDEKVVEMDIRGESIFDLPEDSPAYVDVSNLLSRLGLIGRGAELAKN